MSNRTSELTSDLKDDAKHLKNEAKETISPDIEALRDSFGQLRDDVTTLLTDALGVGKHGAGALKNRASQAAEGVKERLNDLKGRGTEKLEVVEDKIAENPLASAAIAFGVGFIIAKLISRR